MEAHETRNPRTYLEVTRSINLFIYNDIVHKVHRTNSKCAISSEREVHRRITKTCIADKRRDLQGQRSRLQGHVEPSYTQPAVTISRFIVYIRPIS